MKLEKLFARVQKVGDGHLIFDEGLCASYAYVLKSGRAKVLKNINGKQIQIGSLKKGDIFGDMALLGRFQNTASVVAEGNVEVGMIPNKTFLEAVNHLPEKLRKEIYAIVVELAYVTELNAHLISRFQELEKDKKKKRDLKPFKKEISQMPELLSQVISLLSKRLDASNEGCAKLAVQLSKELQKNK